jgi:mannose PTS system EIIAB component
MQTVVNIRVDERLIHGQVAIVWTHVLEATRIMVVDDQIVTDELQKPLLKMACPSGVKLSILSAEKAAENLLASKYDGDKIFMVVKRPETLIQLWDAGFHMESVNIGNMSGGNNTRQLKKAVCVTEKNIETFKELDRRKVKMNAQMIPDDPELNLMNLINK